MATKSKTTTKTKTKTKTKVMAQAMTQVVTVGRDGLVLEIKYVAMPPRN
jgi:hypothetical protein